MSRKGTRNYKNEYEELKEAIKEYSSTLKKAQSQKRLANYHKLYLENLETKVNQSHEKKCNKISNIIEPGIFTITDFNILPVLYKHQRDPLEISLPTTLYFGKTIKFIVAGHQQLIFSTKKSINNYFLRDLPSNSTIPICLFKPKNSRIILFYDFASVQKHLAENITAFGYYQYFIPPTGPYASILLSHITKAKTIKSYIINNKKSIHPKETQKVAQTTSIISNERSEMLLSKYILDIIRKQKPVKKLRRQATFAFPNNDFDFDSDHEEKLLNPFSGDKDFKTSAELKRRTSSMDNPHINIEFQSVDNEDKLDIYLVNTQSNKDITPYAVRIGIPEIDIMTKAIFNLVSTHMKKACKNDVDEMTLIFIRDSMKRWHFLNVKAIKLLQPHGKQPKICDISNVSDDSFVFPFANESMVLNRSSIITFNSQPKEIAKKYIRVRSISDIKATSFLEKQRQKKANKRIVVNLNEHLNNSVGCYDDMMSKIRFKTNHSQRFDIKYNAECFWKEYSIKVHKTIAQSSIAKFFTNSSNDKFYLIYKAILKVCCFDLDQRFRDSLKKTHKNLNIKAKDFEIFKTVILTVLNDYNIESKDIELISANLNSLKHLIVINSS